MDEVPPLPVALPLSASFYPLSALNPVKFTYRYNSEEKLAEKRNLFDGGFSYYEYEMLNGFKDATLSKKNCLVLTDIKALDLVFKEKPTKLTLGNIAGCVNLKARNGKYFTTYRNQVFIGGVGKKLFLNLIPISGNVVELKSGEDDAYLQIDEGYPYTIRLSNEVLSQNETYRRRFTVDYTNNQMTLQVQTNEGPRYVSYSSVDRQVRATGLELNETIINPYRLDVELISKGSLLYNFNPITDEIKYFNELAAFKNRRTLELKQTRQKDTNYIVSCPISEMANSDEVVINIALSKTNFSSSGTYSIES